MSQLCTCSLRTLARRAAYVTARSSAGIPVFENSINRTSAFSTSIHRRFPRQATPFRKLEVDYEEGLLADETAGSSTSDPWYMSESPAASSSASAGPSSTPAVAPSPPSSLPSFLHPMWTHLYESPFLDQASINFIDSRAAQASLDVADMDSSVSTWVDWVIVTSLRPGRERGIRGASDGVQLAMKECLKVLSQDLGPDATGKRKRKLPKVLSEGLDVRDPQWCLVDGGRAIVHIMTEQARQTWEVETVALGGAVPIVTSPAPL